MESLIIELRETFPAREKQIDQLCNLFAHKDEPFVDNVYVYGGPSTGKSALVSTLLEKQEIPTATINLIECYTAKILFESILNQLSGHKINASDGQPYARCDNMMDFIFHLQNIARNREFDAAVIVLDKAEELRNMDFNLLPAMLRLRELTGVSITAIFLSEIILEKYYFKSNIVEPVKIYFPQYTKDELLEILALDEENIREMLRNNFDEPFEFDSDFYRNYLNVFLSVFYRVCRDLSELRHMSRLNFVKYCQPIVQGEVKASNSMALWRNVAPILKSSLEVLYLRISNNQNQTNSVQNFELPFYAKYMLIAAYLASYNSAKDDKRLFTKHHGKKMKTMNDIKLKSKVSEQLNTQLGPKPFSLDRLLAIFYSILDDKVGFNNHLLVQISSLVELQLLSLASDNCTLDARKYKCNVNFEFIQGVSRMVGFNVRKYLSDFSHS